MFITEGEVRRIVSIHFKEKYGLNVGTEEMEWESHNYDLDLTGLEVGGEANEEDYSDSD